MDQIIDPATAPIDTLPGSGTFLVTTAHSTYVIDVDGSTFERLPGELASPLEHLNGKPLKYHHIECDVDARMVIKTDAALSGWVHSTPVVGIDAWPTA